MLYRPKRLAPLFSEGGQVITLTICQGYNYGNAKHLVVQGQVCEDVLGLNLGQHARYLLERAQIPELIPRIRLNVRLNPRFLECWRETR